MKLSRRLLVTIVVCSAIFSDMPALCDDYVIEIDTVRAAMTEIGSKLPAAIRSARGQDVRSLERVFEINNYALVTIESYLKMLKIYSLSGGYGREEIVKLLNNWLSFIASGCTNDIEYLEETAAATQDKAVRDIIIEEKNNLAKLLEAVRKGEDENIRVFTN